MLEKLDRGEVNFTMTFKLRADRKAQSRRRLYAMRQDGTLSASDVL
jgi:hypothetical protein